MAEVLVLDGNQRPALAAVRSLGKRGIPVAVGAENEPSLASSSRYCSRSFVYPSPYDDPGGFLAALKEQAARSRGAVLFPMTDVTLGEVLRRKAELAGELSIPFVDYDRYIAVSDKTRLFRRAARIGVPMPATVIPSDGRDGAGILREARTLGFPLVIKPGLSRIRTGNGFLDAGVRYARDEKELMEVLSRDVFARFPFLIQERIQGPGVGIFLLMDRGSVAALFAHRRLREKPPSGGVSVLCESVKPPGEALDAAIRLLGDVGWTGVAMVEFKMDEKDGRPKLMEINARFWGSLQLAIASGVDFPYLLYRMARGESVGRAPGYRTGIRSRWELGDLDHLLIRLRRSREALSLPARAPSRLALLGSFMLDFIRPSVSHEVLRLADPRPFLHEAKRYVAALGRRPATQGPGRGR